MNNQPNSMNNNNMKSLPQKGKGILGSVLKKAVNKAASKAAGQAINHIFTTGEYSVVDEGLGKGAHYEKYLKKYPPKHPQNYSDYDYDF